MVEVEGDPLNAAILESRRQLHDLQASLGKPDIDYSTVLQQLSETTSKLKAEADNISSEKFTESTILPISQPPRPAPLIEQVRAVSPKEYRPFKTNQALELRKKYIKPTVTHNKPLPKLREKDKNLPATELIKRGIVSEADDLSELLPTVQPGMYKSNQSMFTGIQIDFQGAAQSYLRKKQEKAREEALFREQEARQRSIEPEVRIEPVVQEEPKEEEKPSMDPSKNPRIYEELQDEFAFQTLLIVRGEIARDTPDFESFQRTNAYRWDAINNVLYAIEKFCGLYGIQYAEIDGRKLSEAAGLKKLNDDDVRLCLVGMDELVAKRRAEAADTIKKNYFRYKHKEEIKERKKLFWAAYKIQSTFRNWKSKIRLMNEARKRIHAVTAKATDLAETLRNQYSKIETGSYVVVHAIASNQDLMRVFDLMYSNVELILVMSSLPPPHIWADFNEFLAHCGIPNANERIHFIVMRELRTGNGTSNKLMCDMRSVQQIRKLVCGRNAFIAPHPDWHSERRLSVDIGIPIFGVVDTTPLASRNGVKTLFNEASIVSTLSTREHRNLDDLVIEMRDLMENNRDLTRWIVRLGFSSSDDAIGWFEVVPEFYDPNADLSLVLKRNIHVKTTPAKFLAMIPRVGATIEAVPALVRSFPSASLLITGNEIRVLGTYDRIHHSPFRFAASIVPSVSVDPDHLIGMARQVGTALLKRGVLGYATVDFICYREGEEEQTLIGFDVRVNQYPNVVNAICTTLCCGFEQSSGKYKIMRGIGEPLVKKSRYAVIHNGLTHPGLSSMPMSDLKRMMFSQGMIFDTLNRTGFKLIFYDAPYEGKSTAICSALTPENALSQMERGYSILQKALAKNSGTDSDSSIAMAIQGLRHYKNRIFP